ncbi:MAG: RnfABCDGE type electron transport complex subunit D, partial [Fulvivirga sp.]
MGFLRDQLDKVKPHFHKGGKWEKFYYIYEAHETLLFVPNHTTKTRGAQIKDAIDMKRMMMTVIISMIPCLLFGIYNVGYQHFLALGQEAALLEIIRIGAIQVLPVVVVSYA